MTTEEIKKMIDGEQVEQLTALFCRHWDVATKRLEALVQDMTNGIDICIEAEVYSSIMRMQSSVMALMELIKLPAAFLFSEYFDRIGQVQSNTSMHQSAMILLKTFTDQPTPTENHESFFGLVFKAIERNVELPEEQKALSKEHLFSVFAQHMKTTDLLTIAKVLGNVGADADDDLENQQQLNDRLMKMRLAMGELSTKMTESRQTMVISLFALMMVPGVLISIIQQKRKNSQKMAQLFNKVLVGVRESIEWWNYWQEHRETLRVVSDDRSMKDIMTAEQSKEREALGQVPKGLFAKWATDRDVFDAEFLSAQLSDDDLRNFIFHLASLSETARELNPTTKFGEEPLVRNELQQVGDAVLEAAHKLSDLVSDKWASHYEEMWQKLIQNEQIFNCLKVTRRSQHNNLFTARFFCHLVGEMKKRAVFSTHSDKDLAKQLTEERHVDTYRKNIQEGMGDESEELQTIFDGIYDEYRLS